MSIDVERELALIRDAAAARTDARRTAAADQGFALSLVLTLTQAGAASDLHATLPPILDAFESDFGSSPLAQIIRAGLAKN